jgi:hypothetical protein
LAGKRAFDFIDRKNQCKAAGVACFVKQLGAHVLYNVVGSAADGMWPNGTVHTDPGGGRWRMHPRDKKGGDMAEWPEDLRVRQWPEVSR